MANEPKPHDPSNEDEQRLRDLSNKINQMMKEAKVGGIIVLTSQQSAEWLTVIPEWSGVQADNKGALSITLDGKDIDKCNETMHFIGCVRDICLDNAKLFTRIWDGLAAAMTEQGAEIEHVPFSGVGHGPSGRMQN